MSKERFTEVISNNLMRGIIIIIMFFKMYKELFFPKTEKKSQTRSQRILRRCFHVFLSRRQSASTIF